MMAVSMGVPLPFVAWLSDQELSTPEELAMVCSRESDVESALLTKMAVRQSAMVLAVREGAHRKHCLSTIFQNPAVQEKIDAILK